GMDARVVAWDPLNGKQLAQHQRAKANLFSDKTERANEIFGIFPHADNHVLLSDWTGVWDWDQKSDAISLMAKNVWVAQAQTPDGKYLFGPTSGPAIWICEAAPK